MNIKSQALQKSSKIFIAGGTGLVGSAIIDNLLQKNYTNLIANYNNIDKFNSTSIKNTDKVKYVQLDLTKQEEVSNFFQEHKPEFVFLAAAKVGGISANNTYRADFIYENMQIQNNVIHQSYKNNVCKLLFLGSTCIYPKNAPQPMTEDSLLTSALEYTNEPYAIAKISGIKMCESYNIQYKTNFISVMPTNLYGPNDNFDLKTSHVLPALLRKIHLGQCLKEENFTAIRNDFIANPIEDFTIHSSEENIISILEKYGIRKINVEKSTFDVSVEIWGSGAPRRELLWSHDMADACVFVLENVNFSDTYSNDNKEIRNTHINIGTGVDVSIKELATLIKDIVEYKGELYFNGTKPDGTMVKLTNTKKLNNLGWKHKKDLRDGIKEIYSWYLDEMTRRKKSNKVTDG